MRIPVVPAIALAAFGAISASAAPLTQRGLVDEVVAAINAGEEAGFLRYSQTRVDAAALKQYPADIWASELAKMFDDTGGITVDRIVGEQAGWVVAEGRDRMTGTRQCLTLMLNGDARRPAITDVTLRGLYAAGPDVPPPSPDEVVQTLSAIADRYAARGLMSGVLLVAKDNKVLFEKAYGESSIAYRAPMLPTTRLSLASIGKSITGVAVAQLVERGKLDYDAPIGRYLPDFPDKAVRDQVTIRQLLSHTSGLGPKDYYQYPAWATDRFGLRGVGDYLRLVKREKIGIGAPKGQFLYSNAGYVLVGAAIERVTGEDFYAYVDRHIFKPAGMTSAFYPEMDSEEHDVATPLTNLFGRTGDGFTYRLGRPRNAITELAGRGGPQGGPVMTARDLLRFDHALQSGKLISAARLKEMQVPHSPSGAGAKGLVGDVREGLGIEVVRQNGHVYYGHTGGDLGIAAMDYWFPDSGLTVILLSNRDPRAARVLANLSRAMITRHTVGASAAPPQQCQTPSS